MLTTRRSPGDAPLPLALRSPSMLGANDGDHRAALAVTTAARWCVAALAATGAWSAIAARRRLRRTKER